MKHIHIEENFFTEPAARLFASNLFKKFPKATHGTRVRVGRTWDHQLWEVRGTRFA